jgi:eukaryotic-like serine/threonine-protein kinase
VTDPSDKDNEPLTVIVPASVAPSGADGAKPAGRNGATLRILSIGILGLVLLLLVVVVVVLPEWVAEREPEPPPPAPTIMPPTTSAPSVDAKRQAKEKREAERLLDSVLRKQTELEAEGVAVWGGADYEAALDTLASGDAQLQAERYAEAAQNYQKLAAELDALRASIPERLGSALAAGDAALAGGDGAQARRSFEIALAIEPNNDRAQQGMSRARVLEEVLALIAAGAEQQASGDLEDAKKSFAAALALDPRSVQARAGHDEVAARIRQRAFNASMSAALTALDAGDFAAARAALARADGIQPGAPEVADAGKRLQLAVQASRIRALRKAAQTLEGEERWQAASERYAAALAIDANAAFARTGQQRSLARARIHAELDAYLAALSRLSAPGPRDNARRLLGAAAAVDAGAEPKLASKVARLGAALVLAETPVQVELRSDNLTDVTLYKVGRFGRFTRRDLELLPGSYVAVGQREGYRDVRVEFTLTAGGDPAPVSIRCEEKI